MGVPTNGLRKAAHFTGRHPNKAGKHDFKSRSMSELAREHYISNEQRMTQHHLSLSWSHVEIILQMSYDETSSKLAGPIGLLKQCVGSVSFRRFAY